LHTRLTGDPSEDPGCAEGEPLNRDAITTALDEQ
jgi:hypothetical protein